MLAQQRDIAPVGAEEHIESIARKRHGAGRSLEQHIADHPREEKTRHAEPMRLVEQIA